MSKAKHRRNNDLRNQYTMVFQGALALAILLVLTAFRVEWRVTPEHPPQFDRDDGIVVDVPDITKQPKTPAEPTKPQVPVAVPNDQPVEDFPDIPDEFNVGDGNEFPLPPPEDDAPEESPTIFLMAQKMPAPKGGLKSLHHKIQYPDLARKSGVEGRVVVQFVVDEHGKVSKAKVIRGIGAGCDKEALRVINSTTFSPGIQRGKPVKVKMTIPIYFKLQ
jgi:protein TonB